MANNHVKISLELMVDLITAGRTTIVKTKNGIPETAKFKDAYFDPYTNFFVLVFDADVPEVITFEVAGWQRLFSIIQKFLRRLSRLLTN